LRPRAMHLAAPSPKPGARSHHAAKLVALIVLAATVGGCRQDMHDAPRYEPLEASTFFADGRSSRTLVANTVPRGQLHEDRHLYEGIVDGKPAETFPFPITEEVMRRGQERYTVFCTPCHGRTGEGNGMIVERGFRKPPSYLEDRLRNAPAGYFFDVMSHGFGAMQDYASQLPVADRWAIAAYIRALQYSQRATVEDVPAAERENLDRPASASASAESREATGQEAH